MQGLVYNPYTQLFYVSSRDNNNVYAIEARRSFFDEGFHSMMPLVLMPARLTLLHVCDQWHSSWVATILPLPP